MKNSLMSYNMIFTVINATYHHVIIWMNQLPMNLMNNRGNFIHDLSFYSIRSVMNYYRIINPRFSVIPIDK